jgi:hypothetical protein
MAVPLAFRLWPCLSSLIWTAPEKGTEFRLCVDWGVLLVYKRGPGSFDGIVQKVVPVHEAATNLPHSKVTLGSRRDAFLRNQESLRNIYIFSIRRALDNFQARPSFILKGNAMNEGIRLGKRGSGIPKSCSRDEEKEEGNFIDVAALANAYFYTNTSYCIDRR